MSPSFRSLTITVALAIGASFVQAQTVGFHGVGIPPEGGASSVHALSASGGVAAGYLAVPQNNRYFPFTWTVEGGRTEYFRDASPPFAADATAISGDGSTLVGNTAWGYGYVYRRSGEFHQIAPAVGFTETSASGVSGDGTIVVGRQYFGISSPSEAFSWTAQGGMHRLGVARPGDFASGANAISRDGSTIVGWSKGGGGGVGFAWRQSTGMAVLPALPGTSSSSPRAVNFDGSIIVGSSGSDQQAVVWRNGEISRLGAPAGSSGVVFPLGVNDAGTVIVGYASSPATRAAIWTPAFGMEFLSDCLARNGIAVPADWTLWQATAVSADGLTIAGWGRNAQSSVEGFVVTIPAPTSAAALALATLCGTRRRRT